KKPENRRPNRKDLPEVAAGFVPFCHGQLKVGRRQALEQVRRKLSVLENGVSDLRAEIVVESKPGEVLQAEVAVCVHCRTGNPGGQIAAAAEIRLEYIEDAPEPDFGE